MASDINLLGPIVRQQGFTITGPYHTGYSVKGAGNVNADQYADIIIGAPGASSEAGAVYVVFGQINTLYDINLLNLTASHGFAIYGANPGDQCGYSVSGAGDINGDGFDDVIIGAPFFNDKAGISYVIFGKANPDNIYLANLTVTQGFSITGATGGGDNGYASGASVSSAGDINNDGYADIIIGAGGAETRPGMAYVIFGKRGRPENFANINLTDDLSTIGQGFSITGAEANDQLGFSVSGAGDVNGDGYDDIIIGANFANGNTIVNLLRGACYVIFGKQSNFTNIDLANGLTQIEGFTVIGAFPLDQIGNSVSGAGDFNNDGFNDVIIGATTARSFTGISYIIFGKAQQDVTNIYLETLSLDQGFFIFGSLAGDKSGWSVSGIGDINNDGYSDVIIGAPNAASNTGISYVIFGNKNDLINNIFLSSLNENQGFSITGTIDDSYAGWSVSSAGDVNRDGVDDLLVGAIGRIYDEGGAVSSSTYIVLGSAIGYKNINLVDLSSSDIAIAGYMVNSNSGYSISEAGDINNDGFNDIIVGSYSKNLAILPTSYVIFGGRKDYTNIDLESLTMPTGFSITGAAFSVSSAGDINGDKYDDIILGFPFFNNNTGIAYVFFGKASGFADASLLNLTINNGFTIYGANPDDQCGYSVSGAGDINGDGLDDIIIGAPFFNDKAGITYVIFGKASGFSNIYLANLSADDGFWVAGVTGGGEDGDASGWSVSGAGDINNDGYDDIIIGAPGAETRPCLAYVIFGKNGRPKDFSNINLADDLSATGRGFSIAGAENADQLGYSVSDAGDVNADGYYDIIIGANDAGVNDVKSGRGASYVIFGKKSDFANIKLSSLTIVQGFSITEPNSFSQLGTSVSGVGDVNNDGCADVIIGAYLANSGTGAAYVVFGKRDDFNNIELASLTESQGFSIYGAYSGDKTGWAVSGAGDVDGNGADDLLIGAPGANLESGVGYLIFSKLAPTPLPTPHPTFGSEDISKNEAWWQSEDFKTARPIIVSLVGSVFSLTAAWLLRQKIVFYVLNNWGYEYKLLYNPEEIPKDKEIGFYLKYNQFTNSKNLFCRIKDTELQVEVDHGNNAGISQGLYNDIVQELKEPAKGTFYFLISEENQIRDFLMSRDFIDFSDLGCMRGSIYHLCLITFKRIHKEKYLHKARIQRSSSLLPEQNPLHEEKDNVASEKEDSGDIELRETNSNIGEHINRVRSNAERERAHSIEKSCILLSIDAMMDPEHVRIQNEEFTKFGNQIMGFVNEELHKDINWLLSSKSDGETLLLENVPKGFQAVVLYESPTLKDNSQFASSDNLISSLLSAKQILYNLPLLHYLTQNIINYLGYNVSLPDPLDNKEMLISVDLVLGNVAAQYLPEQSIMNGILISTASTVGYAARLIATDYLKNQEPSDDPIEFSMQCVSTIVAYALPGVVNYALTKAILPDAKMSISTLDMLGSSSFGVMQCYNNYKVVYSTQIQATVTDVVAPYIADAVALFTLGRQLQFDASNSGMLMLSVKNTISVSATVYATDCMARMVMDVVQDEVKEEYLDPILDQVIQLNYDMYYIMSNSCEQIIGLMTGFFNNNNE